MKTQAPYDYVRDYYKNVVNKAERFPTITNEWMDILKFVNGEHVLNIGCGPTLFDYIPHFGDWTKVCTGIDINEDTFHFLRRSMVPELVRARKLIKKGLYETDVRMICDDVTKNICPSEAEDGLYDSVLAVGFLAGHHGLGFDNLMQQIWERLRVNGTLVVVSWFGPWRSAKESQKKKTYRYEQVEWTDPSVLVCDIHNAGFRTEQNRMLSCYPAYGWDHIQSCVFRKT